MSDQNQCHQDILEAFRKIDLNGMLAWAVLDQKPEKYITVALAAALNAERRRALTEHSRLDLVLIDGWAQDRNHRLRAGYEAKCEHLARFAGTSTGTRGRRRRARTDGRESATAEWYNGGCLAADLRRAETNDVKWQGCPVRGGLFYVIEMSPATEHSKFLPRHPGENLTVQEAVVKIQNCVKRERFGCAECPAVRVQEVKIQLHLVLFDASGGTNVS